MKFMMMVKGDKDYEAGLPPSPELMAAVGKVTEQQMKAGVVVATGGLMPSSKGAIIRVLDGNLSVTDGPFPETKEVIGGYAIIQASSKEEAIRLGSEFMQAHVDAMGSKYSGECEVRQLYEFGEC